MTSGRIPQAFIHELIERTDIVEIIRARIPLKHAGANYQGVCPFHQEKTPSFSVNAKKQFYYCFGCGASGNVITFLMEHQNLTFLDAVADLAALNGLEIPKEAQNFNLTQNKPLYDCLDKVAHFYYQQLAQSATVIDYLKARGLSGTICKTYQIGYAPKAWRHLDNIDCNEADLIASGMLIQKPNKEPFCRFRDRIMFPIRDTRGRYIAFGGRQLNKENPPKYLNSPETPIFHKSNEVFGLFEAKQYTQKLTSLILVEGYMDVIGLAQQGIRNAVATLGTAINLKHFTLLLRHTDEVTVCFDGDDAGRTAAWRALTVALPAVKDGIKIQFLFLPDGEDPDSLVQKIGKARFEDHLKNALSLPDYFFSHLQETCPLTTEENRARLVKEAHALLKTIPEGIFAQLMYQRLASLVDIELEQLKIIVDHNIDSSYPSTPPPSTTNAATAAPPTEQHSTLGELALSMIVKDPSLAQTIPSIEPLEQLNNKTLHRLVKLIHLLHKNKEITSTGQLLAYFDDKKVQAYFSRLAAHEGLLEKRDNEMAAEFTQIIERLLDQLRKQLITNLINKGKQSPLSQEEKQHLSQLLGQNPAAETSEKT